MKIGGKYNRIQLPQLNTSNIEAFKSKLNELGIGFVKAKVPIKNIKFLQNEIDLKKVVELKNIKKEDCIFILTNNMECADGHHRIVTLKLRYGDEEKLDCLILNRGIEEITLRVGALNMKEITEAENKPKTDIDRLKDRQKAEMESLKKKHFEELQRAKEKEFNKKAESSIKNIINKLDEYAFLAWKTKNITEGIDGSNRLLYFNVDAPKYRGGVSIVADDNSKFNIELLNGKLNENATFSTKESLLIPTLYRILG